MRIGDLIESGIWVTGDEPPGMRAQYEQDVRDAISYLCYEHGFVSGPVMFTEKHPESDVIEVPDHIHGSRVRLLVGEAAVVEKRVETSIGSFVANLELSDLKKLREIIRRYRPMNDAECDELIEQIGPDAALDTLRKIH